MALMVGGFATVFVAGIGGLIYLNKPQDITWQFGLFAGVFVAVMLALGTVAPLCSVLARAWVRTVIEASPAGVRVSWTGLIGEGSDAEKASSIRDIDLRQGVMTRNRNVDLRLVGLTADEEAWVFSAVVLAFTSTAGGSDSERGVAFACPHCDEPLEFGAGAAGTHPDCPACKMPVRVPVG